jgi:hypothetical protein
LIHGPVHVALDCGLVALDPFAFAALGNTQPLPGDLKIGSFLFMVSTQTAKQVAAANEAGSNIAVAGLPIKLSTISVP